MTTKPKTTPAPLDGYNYTRHVLMAAPGWPTKLKEMLPSVKSGDAIVVGTENIRAQVRAHVEGKSVVVLLKPAECGVTAEEVWPANPSPWNREPILAAL